MGWLAAVFVWFAGTVLRGQRRHFVAGTFTSAFVVIALLFAWNPDRQIVRANSALSQTGHHFDADYALSLSADAVPELMHALPTISAGDQRAVATQLLKRGSAPKSADWRSWCWGRWRARQDLLRNQAHLVTLSRIATPVVPTTSGSPATVTTIITPSSLTSPAR